MIKWEQNEWEACKSMLRNQIPANLFSTFIEPLNPHLSNEALDIISPGNSDTVSHIESRYMPLICQNLKKIGYQGQVRINTQIANPATKPFTARNKTSESINTRQKKATHGHQTFLPSRTNEMMVNALLENKGPRMAIIAGPSGCGKSHLLKNISMQSQARGIEARHLSLETFLTEFSLACKNRDTVKWRQNLRANQVLTIDDFHYLKNTAARTSEELHHLVDEFQNSNQSIYFSSAVPIRELRLPQELKSRLLSIPLIQLEYPDQKTRERILELGFNQESLPIDPGVISYIAERISRDVRLLKSSIDRLRPYLSHKSMPDHFSAQKLDHILGDLYFIDKQVDPGLVLETVAQYFQITVDDITGISRQKTHSMARHVVAYLCMDELGWGLKETAHLICRKDHGTVIHACKKITDLLKKDLFLAANLVQIKATLHKS